MPDKGNTILFFLVLVAAIAGVRLFAWYLLEYEPPPPRPQEKPPDNRPVTELRGQVASFKTFRAPQGRSGAVLYLKDGSRVVVPSDLYWEYAPEKLVGAVVVARGEGTGGRLVAREIVVYTPQTLPGPLKDNMR